MKKNIIARCTDKVWLNDEQLLFAVGDIVKFEVTEFECEQPDWVCPYYKDKEETFIRRTEKHLRYTTKMGCWEFNFYDKDFVSLGHNVPPFEDAFIQIDMRLTAENVSRIFKDCLSTDKKGKDVTRVPAVLENVEFAFDTSKLSIYKKEIESMINELPEKFHERNGGGWSFLQLCMKRDESQWTGLHFVMEQLLCLGVGIKAMKYLLPRQMWSVLPGGMPYVAIIDK